MACEPPLQARSKAGTVPQDQASFSCLSRLGGPGGSQKLNMSEWGGPGRAKGRRETVDPRGYHSPRSSGAETQGQGADKRREDKLQLCALSRTAQHQAPNASSQRLSAPAQSPVPQVPTPPLLDVEVSPGSPPWVVSHPQLLSQDIQNKALQPPPKSLFSRCLGQNPGIISMQLFLRSPTSTLDFLMARSLQHIPNPPPALCWWKPLHRDRHYRSLPTASAVLCLPTVFSSPTSQKDYFEKTRSWCSSLISRFK